MQVRYFTQAEINQFISNGQLRDDILAKDCIGICSIADVLEICEIRKKEILDSHGLITSRKFDGLVTGPVRMGFIYIAELNQENLLFGLFEREDHVIYDLWYEAANREVSPTHSIRLLTLRPNQYSWWTEELYQEMLRYYSYETQ